MSIEGVDVYFTWDNACWQTFSVVGNNVLINIVELDNDAWSFGDVIIVPYLLEPEYERQVLISIKSAATQSFNLSVFSSLNSGHLQAWWAHCSTCCLCLIAFIKNIVIGIKYELKRASLINWDREWDRNHIFCIILNFCVVQGEGQVTRINCHGSINFKRQLLAYRWLN